MKPYTFANGVTIPTGTKVHAPLWSIHTDDTIYENPKEFDGFRFSNMREKNGEGAKHHASNTSTDYLQFGHGQHAWYHIQLRTLAYLN
jgi:cytochrome P450